MGLDIAGWLKGRICGHFRLCNFVCADPGAICCASGSLRVRCWLCSIRELLPAQKLSSKIIDLLPLPARYLLNATNAHCSLFVPWIIRQFSLVLLYEFPPYLSDYLLNHASPPPPRSHSPHYPLNRSTASCTSARRPHLRPRQPHHLCRPIRLSMQLRWPSLRML